MKMSQICYPLLCIGRLVYALWVLAFGQADMLYMAQNFAPWMGTHEYLMDHLRYPGGMREWAGDWLTQLFYYPALGTAVMVTMWGIALCALKRGLNLSGASMLLPLIPILCLLASLTQLGYWIFCLKTQSYWFGPTLGFFSVAIGFLGYTISTNTIHETKEDENSGVWYQVLYLAIWCIAGYYLLGWYAVLGALMMCLWQTSHKGISRTTLLQWGTMAISLLLITGGMSRTSGIEWREPMLLYGFHWVEIPEHASPLLSVTFWIMAASLLLMALKPGRWNLLHKTPVVILLLAAALMGANMMNYRNANFLSECRMLRAMEESRWEDLLNEMKQLDREPTREMVLMKDVALAQLGKLGDESFNYPYVGVRPQMTTEVPIHMNHSAGPYIYYWLGMPNFAFMWCQEDNIEYGMSPFFLKLMYRSMMCNGESEAAAKFKALLKGSLFYADFAISQEEIENVRCFMSGNDEVTNDRGFVEIYLLDRLSREQYDNAKAQQLAVHFAILARNRKRFGSNLSHYLELIGDDQALPRYFTPKTFNRYYDTDTGKKSY